MDLEPDFFLLTFIASKSIMSGTYNHIKDKVHKLNKCILLQILIGSHAESVTYFKDYGKVQDWAVTPNAM